MTTGAASEEGFRELLDRHAAGVAAVLRRALRGPEEVADALQQTLLQAWGARDRYDATRPFGAWLRTIAVRVAHDRRRARARQREARGLDELAGDPAARAADAASDPELVAEARDELARLRRELAALDERTRRIFTMFYDEQLPVAAIAATLALPVNTVKTHLHRARRELARRLGERG